MKTKRQRKALVLSKSNISKISFDHLSKIKGGTRSTALSEGQTNEGEHTCVLF